MKTLSCRDAGQDCDFVASGQDEDEVLRKATQHGAQKHNMQQMSQDMERKLRSKIKNA